MLAEFENWQVRHIFREDNKQADELVNRALDVKKDVEMKIEKAKKAKPVRLGVLISGGRHDADEPGRVYQAGQT